MSQNKLRFFVFVLFFLFFPVNCAWCEQIRAFVPDKPWEIAIEIDGFIPWDVLQAKTILGGNTTNGLIITILTEKENRLITTDKALHKYWHYELWGERITEFENADMIIVSSRESHNGSIKTINGYAVKEDYSFEIHITADLAKITKQKVIDTLRSFQISVSPEKQAIEQLSDHFNVEKNLPMYIDLLTRFSINSPKNSYVFATLGEIYFSNSQLDKAEKAYLNAIENHRTMPIINPQLLWFCYDGLGMIYGMSQRFEPSKRFLERGYKCAEMMSDNDKMASSAYNLACLYAETKETDACLKFLGKAIKLQPRYKTSARTDSSFIGIRDQLDFQKLISE